MTVVETPEKKNPEDIIINGTSIQRCRQISSRDRVSFTKDKFHESDFQAVVTLWRKIFTNLVEK